MKYSNTQTTLFFSRVDTIVTDDPNIPLTPIPVGLLEQELSAMEKATTALTTCKALKVLLGFLQQIAGGGIRQVSGISAPDFKQHPDHAEFMAEMVNLENSVKRKQ